MKEPLVADYIERFLEHHNLSDKPKVPSRPTSVRSRSPRSPSNHQRRLSFRLSQAELLDYSHQQQVLNNNLSDDSTITPTNQSPRDSMALPPTGEAGSTSTPPSPAAQPQPTLTSTLAAAAATIAANDNATTGRPDLPHRLSHGATTASLDAAVVQM